MMRSTNNRSDFRSELTAILKKNAGFRLDGKVASERSIQQVEQVLFNAFEILRHERWRDLMPTDLGNRHIEFLCHYWFHDKKLSIKTLVNYFGCLRKFAVWIGKEQMVKRLCEYLPDDPPEKLVIRSVAIKSKSWSAAGINIEEKIQEAFSIDKRFGLMLMAAHYFGMRGKEALHFQPHEWDFDTYIFVPSGKAKNGKSRCIQIRNDVQRNALDFIKSQMPMNEHLGWYFDSKGKKSNLYSNRNCFNYLLQKIGITKKLAGVSAHGLRAGFAEDNLIERGWIPPTKGGPPNQLPAEEKRRIKTQVSYDLGHNRPDFGSAYYGSEKRGP